MSPPVLLAGPAWERTLADLSLPLDPDALLGGGRRDWEVEIGFGKGRYLLRRAVGEPQRGFLGIEVATQYFRLLQERAGKRRVQNLLLFRGQAETVLATVLPRGFASAVHVYFPDPWPKAKHERRRLLDPESVDLVLGLLRPGATLSFATDHPAYGEAAAELLASHPGTVVRQLEGVWPDGARTNYEAKYIEEGRPIVRLEVGWQGAEGVAALHPAGLAGVLAAYRADAAIGAVEAG